LGLALAVSCTAAPQEFSGPDLAQRLGCRACHYLKGRGGNLGAPLDQIGSRFTAAELKEILSYPRSRHPQARMPSYAYVRPQEMQALVDYLRSQ
jgi:cbb3-type cytochrome oxidase cytochrome c subunit